ncbi:hypothetical protein Daus18300_004439 [Diaporthe australafricana]|uniref:Aromatic amino acid beta-eliminating lyase/threonine aldolase domain-containing protein n=1 Tax=Diaporthe australafricana TaxID=127596 RepID=A0ABR3X8U1_9PEZI
MPAAKEQNAWIGYRGAAGCDLRSDTQTTPTPSMLAAIANCTLLDDVFEEDTTTIDLEAHCAALAGKEAGLLMLSGTMGNQVALRSLLTQPPHGVLCDHRSHIVVYEAGGVSALTGAMLEAVRPSNGIHLTLEDVQEHAHVDDNVHTCPTRVISLENTLNGMLMPLSEAQRISAWARGCGIKMHLDGARLWEVAASGAGSIREFADCFDTLTLCFSKGLGAPIGSILLGTKSVIKQARWTRKSIGGGLRQSGVVSAAARVAVDETFGSDPTGKGGLLRKSHEMAARVARMWTDLGGRLTYPPHTNMVWLDLKDAGCSDARIAELGAEQGLRLLGGRVICHYQSYQNADVVLPGLEAVFKTILAEKGKGVEAADAAANGNGAKALYK